MKMPNTVKIPPSMDVGAQVQADVDKILTVAQKAEYEDFRRQIQKRIEDFRKQMSANGSNMGNGQGQAGQSRSDQNNGTQMTPLQRRQRDLDGFIKVLQDRQKQLGA